MGEVEGDARRQSGERMVERRPMRGRVVEKPAAVFRSTSGAIGAQFAEVAVGAEIEFGEARLISGRQYTSVLLPDGQQGYIFGDTKVVTFKRLLLKADKVPVRAAPGFDSPVVTTLAKGTSVLLVETVEREGTKWNKLRGPGDAEGYVEASIPVVIVPDATKAASRVYLSAGLRWLAAAAALGFLGGALGLRFNGMLLMMCVPLFQAARFLVLTGWHWKGARV